MRLGLLVRRWLYGGGLHGIAAFVMFGARA
jgi:hypothetical protein